MISSRREVKNCISHHLIPNHPSASRDRQNSWVTPPGTKRGAVQKERPTSPFTNPKLEPAVPTLAVNFSLWPLGLMCQPPPWLRTWRLAGQAIILQMVPRMDRKKITCYIQFLSICIVILGSPAAYFKCPRDKWEGMRCTHVIIMTVPFDKQTRAVCVAQSPPDWRGRNQS